MINPKYSLITSVLVDCPNASEGTKGTCNLPLAETHGENMLHNTKLSHPELGSCHDLSLTHFLAWMHVYGKTVYIWFRWNHLNICLKIMCEDNEYNIRCKPATNRISIGKPHMVSWNRATSKSSTYNPYRWIFHETNHTFYRSFIHL